MADPIIIPDDSRSLDASDCIYPSEYEGHLSTLMIKREEILTRTAELAKIIHKDYQGRRPVLLCVLKGASPFFQHLLEALQDLRQGYYMEFLRVSSYEGTSTTGKISIDGNGDDGSDNNKLYKELKGKDVIIVEDIVDTGTTLSLLMPILEEKATPKSMQVCSLLAKRLDQPAKVDAKYIGFSIPNHFIIGYGLDYNELYRDLKDIWVISQQGIDFDQSTLLE